MNWLPYFDVKEVAKLRSEGHSEEEFNRRLMKLAKWQKLSEEESKAVDAEISHLTHKEMS